MKGLGRNTWSQECGTQTAGTPRTWEGGGVNHSLRRKRRRRAAAFPSSPAPFSGPPRAGAQRALPRSQILPRVAGPPSTPDFFRSLPPASGVRVVASPANSPATLPAGTRARARPGLRRPRRWAPPPVPTGTSVNAAAGAEPRGARRAAGGGGRAGGPDAGSDPEARPAPESSELPDRPRPLLCAEASLLAQVRPPASPAFPEAFKGDPAGFLSF